jgi:hypothetical protein
MHGHIVERCTRVGSVTADRDDSAAAAASAFDRSGAEPV